LAYRKQQGLPLTDLRSAVLVQELVPSDVSAVVFSANPVTGSSDEVVVPKYTGPFDLPDPDHELREMVEHIVENEVKHLRTR
jgi:hypothetical protein